MNIPLGAANSHTTEHILELALAMLDDARREQNNVQLPANNWLTDNFTLEIIRAKWQLTGLTQRLTPRIGAQHIYLGPSYWMMWRDAD
jgi:hypothetical protein